MSVFKWSDEQEQAISHQTEEHGSAVVSAAAGSGKTAMLVERVTRMITCMNPKIPADKIVAVTFTEKAAGELKERLEKSINNEINNSIDRSGWLSEQLVNLENARICTISAFCIRLIREFAEESGLKPDFKICDEKESERYSEKALDYALEKIYDVYVFTAEEKISLRSMTGEAGDSKLGRAVSELYKEYIKQPFPERWLEEKAALYNDIKGFKNFIVPDIEARIKDTAESCFESISECLKLSYSDKTTEKLEKDRAFAESWVKSDLFAGERGLLEYGGANPGGKVSEKNRSASEKIKANRNIYTSVFKEIITEMGMFADFDFVTEKQRPQALALVKFFRLYLSKFRELKAEANRVDFSDAEHYCLKLLQNTTAAAAIRNSFHEIIVDEFQDSNAVQYEIFKGISDNGKNLFLVGDIKQSIYRFRNADQRVFAGVTGDRAFTTLTLNKNYRSSAEVIKAVNNIFEKTMTKEVGGVDYGDNSKLVFGTGVEGGAGHEAEIIVIEADEGISEKDAEARYIASRINAMVNDKFTVADKETGLRRPCGYGDFAVIISALGTVEEEFSKSFEEYGIPYDKQKSGDYSGVNEVKTILALLTVLDHPYADMALLTALMSPLYGFTARDAANVRVSGADKPLFRNLEAQDRTSPVYTKARAFLRDYHRWSSYARNYGACGLVRLIYNEGAFNPLIAASANPEKTLINVRLLLHYSESLKSLTGDTLAGLTDALGESGGTKLEEARYSGEAETGASGRVRLMTIHASKGLEFPICFVARTNAGFNLKENYPDIIFNDNIGFAMRYIIPETRTRCDTLTHKKIRGQNEAALISEEMRKLYVACTRARDKLILTAARKSGVDGEISEKTYLNWLLKSEIKARTVKASDTEVNSGRGNITERSGETADSESDTAAEIISAVNKIYKREPLTKIPRRVTATQVGIQKNASGFEESGFIFDDMLDEPMIFPRGPSFMGNRKLTGKKRGDAYHKMMELLDFGKGDYEQQMILYKNRFTEEEYAAVEPAKILGFFSSSLGKRAVSGTNPQKEYKLCTEINLSELGYPGEYDEMFDEKPFVQGVADMFFYEDGGIVLVDYKTNRLFGLDRSAARRKLAELYKGQLDIYARAIEEMTGDRVREKWLYSFEYGEIIL